MADTETETTAKTATLTEYVILSSYTLEGDHARAGVEGWEEAAVTVQARSAEDALRRHGQHGTFVAIPARSWKPVTVTAKQTTTLDLKPAT